MQFSKAYLQLYHPQNPDATLATEFIALHFEVKSLSEARASLFTDLGVLAMVKKFLDRVVEVSRETNTPVEADRIQAYIDLLFPNNIHDTTEHVSTFRIRKHTAHDTGTVVRRV